MQIYDIILVWTIWVGVLEHHAFKRGNMSGCYFLGCSCSWLQLCLLCTCGSARFWKLWCLLESCFSLIGSSDFWPLLVHCLAWCKQNKNEGHKIITHIIINSFLAYLVTLHCFVFYLCLTHCWCYVSLLIETYLNKCKTSISLWKT